MLLPEEICDLTNRQTFTSDPDKLPNSPIIVAFLPKLEPCLETSRKEAKVEMAPSATGAEKS